MCGIAGMVVNVPGNRDRRQVELGAMSALLEHRGPDDAGWYLTDDGCVGLAHRRLSIIDLSPAGRQPMEGMDGNIIVFNGEIYNYRELHDELASTWEFRTRTDTETILAAYHQWGEQCLDHLRGMFAFALWDVRHKKLFCARDRFGIKPFYYSTVGDTFYFASEIKAMLPFLPAIETNREALAEYLTFQYTIGEQTLFEGVKQILPGHALTVRNGQVRVWRYWDVDYHIDLDHTPRYFVNRLRELLDESVRLHLRSDVPVGSYLSGGVDSSLVSILASRENLGNRDAFHGKFTDYPGYDESHYAEAAARAADKRLHQIIIGPDDFRNYLAAIIYHLDHPVAGPGAFPQYMVSWLASRQVKVVLGGQGGDEIFGGYARYLLAYFEQCIKAAIDGTYRSSNYVVTIESIIPNLGVLREYKPMMQLFWKEGLFGDLDERYFRLIDRSADMADEVDWSLLDRERVFEDFKAIFNNSANVRKEAYLDKMTHFDFKCLLPALLQVEDRMSMAHGLESRVPLLDHPVVEFAATVPADVKFEGGRMKRLLKLAYTEIIPSEIMNRRDKMGFPVPLKEWAQGELREFIQDIFRSQAARSRPFMKSEAIIAGLDHLGRYSRKLWGLLSLEVWYQQFHDRAAEFRRMVEPQSKAASSLHGCRVDTSSL